VSEVDPAGEPWDAYGALMRAAYGAIPVIGPALVEVFNWLHEKELRSQGEFIRDRLDAVGGPDELIERLRSDGRSSELFERALRLAGPANEDKRVLMGRVVDRALRGEVDDIDQAFFLLEAVNGLEAANFVALAGLARPQENDKWLRGVASPEVAGLVRYGAATRQMGQLGESGFARITSFGNLLLEYVEL
jgi:hypothetical protein